mmetsp:Transcript_33134/g.69287  ORF Transcript_33134/g.69287 Transcript_33134/m.69287 type:complete len:273 (-) Transcript_33134:753-1571(-)
MPRRGNLHAEPETERGRQQQGLSRRRNQVQRSHRVARRGRKARLCWLWKHGDQGHESPTDDYYRGREGHEDQDRCPIQLEQAGRLGRTPLPQRRSGGPRLAPPALLRGGPPRGSRNHGRGSPARPPELCVPLLRRPVHVGRDGPPGGRRAGAVPRRQAHSGRPRRQAAGADERVDPDQDPGARGKHGPRKRGPGGPAAFLRVSAGRQHGLRREPRFGGDRPREVRHPEGPYPHIPRGCLPPVRVETRIGLRRDRCGGGNPSLVEVAGSLQKR